MKFDEDPMAFGPDPAGAHSHGSGGTHRDLLIAPALFHQLPEAPIVFTSLKGSSAHEGRLLLENANRGGGFRDWRSREMTAVSGLEEPSHRNPDEAGSHGPDYLLPIEARGGRRFHWLRFGPEALFQIVR